MRQSRLGDVYRRDRKLEADRYSFTGPFLVFLIRSRIICLPPFPHHYPQCFLSLTTCAVLDVLQASLNAPNT